MPAPEPVGEYVMLMSYAFPTSGIHLEISGKGNVAPAPVSVPWLRVGAAVAPAATTVATTRATSASAAARDFFMALHPLPSRLRVNRPLEARPSLRSPDRGPSRLRGYGPAPLSLGERVESQWDASVNS